jgi:uncharacterized protein (TIGR04562 family)
MPFIHLSLDLLDVLAGNQSIVDLKGLFVVSREQAQSFLLAYGFDPRNEEDQKKLIYYYRRSLVFLFEKLNVSETSFPDELKNIETIDGVIQLLLNSSQQGGSDLKNWSCALLRVMHAFIHAENDLFHLYSNEIQKQILSPIQDCILIQGSEAKPYLKSPNESYSDTIPLEHFEVKPHKTSVSSVIKLLAKADTHVINLHDKVGVRFVTENTYDAFRVLEFLIQNHLVGVAHVMAGQTTNTLYPISLLREFFASLKSNEMPLNPESFEKALLNFQKTNPLEVPIVKKENAYSAEDYQFIKFVARKLIRLPADGGRFFYPYEVQILTKEAYLNSHQGQGDHKLYKQRQLEAAKKRILSL